MAYSSERLNVVFSKTAGRCHLCRKKLAWINYGAYGQRAAWEVDHSRARANGGSDHLNNLFPACVSCNRSKQHGSSRDMRAVNGITGVPLSEAQLANARSENAFGGGLLGAGVGLLLGGGPLILGLGLIGALVGAAKDPDDN